MNKKENLKELLEYVYNHKLGNITDLENKFGKSSVDSLFKTGLIEHSNLEPTEKNKLLVMENLRKKQDKKDKEIIDLIPVFIAWFVIIIIGLSIYFFKLN